MNKLFGIFILSSLLLAYTCCPAFATSVLFDGGPADYSKMGGSVSTSPGLAKQFIINGDSVITGASFFAWTGYTTPLTINWAVTTAPFGGTTEASGVASVGYESLGYLAAILCSWPGNIGNPGYAIAGIFDFGIASFAIPSLSLSSGTYYLQLSGAVSSPDIGAGEFVNWDVDNGPSGADFYDESSNTTYYVNFAPTFQIVGTSAPVPEPGTFLLLGIGLIGLNLVRNRLKK